MPKSDLMKIIDEAREAGRKAAQVKLEELKRVGPVWIVTDDLTGKSVGTMLDVCGFAHINLKISGHDKRWQELKRLAEVNTNRIHVWSDGSKTLSIFDMSMRQELSVNESACEGALTVLKNHGFDGYVESRID